MAKKLPTPTPAAAPAPARSTTTIVIGVVVAAAVLVGAYAMMRSPAQPAADASPAASQAAPATPPANPPATPAAQQTAAAEPVPEQAPPSAKFGPHTQASYPPLPASGYPPPRPVEVVNAAYRFAAEHPEVLSYIPCYCGCERQGHNGNEDCFVARRSDKGDVESWDSHGMT